MPTELTPSIKTFLDRMLDRYHRTDFLSSDPLEFVHAEKDPRDQEAVAFLSALFAYGNVTQIRKSVALGVELLRNYRGGIQKSVRAIGDLSGESLKEFVPVREHFSTFYHRFNVSDDLVILIWLVARSWKEFGSVGEHFLRYLGSSDRDVTHAMNGLMSDWLQWTRELPFESPSFRYLVTRPQDGSCCKRWCMLLRWMGRHDSLDPGLWRKGSPLIRSAHGLSASQLVMPLDTHTGRISQYIGLTQRKTLHWKAAQEITERLREFDPDDPTKYDFALSRLGILDFCQKKFRAEICVQCDLVKVCLFARKNLKKSLSTAAR